MEPVFDSEEVLRRRLRAARRPVPGADFLMRHACEDLELRLSAVERPFEPAADLFSGSALPAEAMRRSGRVADVLRVEAAAELFGAAPGLVAPAETIPLPPESLDLAVSMLALQEVNDLPGLLVQARRALRPDGLLLAAFAGQGTLAELKESLLAAETEVTDVEPLTVRYDTMFGLMRDLRAMGATNALAARTRRPATRLLFARAAEIYAERFSDPDGRVRATFSIVWMSGWVPHASQQKPLKPGSAKASLAGALEEAARKGRGGGGN